ncbi:SWIB/MDM2 domain [Macleaya cordata]|uniref:SWIB/MDM2 domain n=1 Tax=Macleaya cordata TaxID=56857 RepID=A0A200Q7Y4_MACCD|nr:SWIB/MDM2 domain [Macleaya cordata]
MVSDQEIANSVETLLRQANPNSVITINGVIQQLEAKLGLDLSHKAGFIRDHIDLLLRPITRPPPPPPKDHFTLQHYPQSQFQNTHPQILPHFALPHHRHEELNFQCPPSNPQRQPRHHHQQQHHTQLQPQPQSHRKPQKAPNNLVPNVAAASGPETPKESAPTGTKRRGGPGGLNKVCGVSPELQAIVGEPTMPRTQIVKQLWAYIRQNNLQDPSNKRKIICNDALRVVFETDCTDMFKMNKLLAKHIIPLEPSKESGKASKKVKVEPQPSTESTERGPPLVIISEALARFFGTGGREMAQSEAIRRVWEYIKVNRLKEDPDPLNGVIFCDPKLQELFGCESISALGLPEMLVPHFFRRS